MVIDRNSTLRLSVNNAAPRSFSLLSAGTLAVALRDVTFERLEVEGTLLPLVEVPALVVGLAGHDGIDVVEPPMAVKDHVLCLVDKQYRGDTSLFLLDQTLGEPGERRFFVGAALVDDLFGVLLGVIRLLSAELGRQLPGGGVRRAR
mgnify:CR=1 FL=1